MSNEFELAKYKAELMFEEKNHIIAYLLLFFLGILGAHRFYLRRFKTAGLMLFLFVFTPFSAFATIFGLIIWCIIDSFFLYHFVKIYNHEIQVKKLAYLSSFIENEDFLANEEKKENEIEIETY